MKRKKDILETDHTLRRLPLGVPAGYFDAMGERAVSTVRNTLSSTVRHRSKMWVAVLSVAACAAVAITAGTLLYYSLRSDSDAEYYASETGSSLSQEDIVQYLIESGVSLEEFNY